MPGRDTPQLSARPPGGTDPLQAAPSHAGLVSTGARCGDTDQQSEWTDVQKKILPWRHAAPDADLELAFQDRAARLGKAISRLIVVASLIDKPTNLGGSCVRGPQTCRS